MLWGRGLGNETNSSRCNGILCQNYKKNKPHWHLAMKHQVKLAKNLQKQCFLSNLSLLKITLVRQDSCFHLKVSFIKSHIMRRQIICSFAQICALTIVIKSIQHTWYPYFNFFLFLLLQGDNCLWQCAPILFKQLIKFSCYIYGTAGAAVLYLYLFPFSCRGQGKRKWFIVIGNVTSYNKC